MKTYSPPKIALKLLQLYCSDERLEELEGDFFELYQLEREVSSKAKSDLIYWWMVITGFRKYAFKKDNSRKISNLSYMRSQLHHNIKITWRNLIKNPSVTAINIIGLSIGISAFLVIFNIVQFELSFNKDIPESDKIYRIHTRFEGTYNGVNRGINEMAPDYIKEHFTGLESVAKFRTLSLSASVESNDGVTEKTNDASTIFCEPSFFDVINQYEWLAGSQKTALTEVNKVVLTDRQAAIYFGEKEHPRDYLGKTVIYRDSLKFQVTGIVHLDAGNTDFIMTDFLSYDTRQLAYYLDWLGEPDWGSVNSSSQLFVKLDEHKTIDHLNNQLEKLAEYTQEQTGDKHFTTYYKAQPVADLHYNTDLYIFDYTYAAAHKPTLLVMSIVAFAILLIAIFNFINLETVQSASRNKEVGVRKVLGGNISTLLGRFLTQSIMIAFLSSIMAIPIVHFSIQYFQEFIPDGLTLPYDQPIFWLQILLFTLIVGTVAGIYPSWVASIPSPNNALKSGFKSQQGHGAILRKILISSQFIFSQVLIVGTFIMVKQINFMINNDLGFEKEGIISIWKPYYESDAKQNTFIAQLDQYPNITEVIRGNAPISQNFTSGTYSYMGKSGKISLSVNMKDAGDHYFDFFDIKFLAGRPLSNDKSIPEVVVNETLVREFGFENPEDILNERIKKNEQSYTVVGVIRDIYFNSMHQSMKPQLFEYTDSPSEVLLKVKVDENFQSLVDELTVNWRELYDDYPLRLRFLDETVKGFYESELRSKKLATTATFISIFISCLGLLGLISFTILQRTKEIGIRKILGASATSLSAIISKEFVYLILIALLVSTPITYLLTNKWLDFFAYKADIGWWIYALGGLTSMLIALLTISVKIWKASVQNPVDSLRYE